MFKTLRRFGQFIKNRIDAFFNTKIGRFVSILVSNGVSRTVTMVTVGLILAGITPFTPALAVPIAATAIAGVIIGAIVDTLKTRSNRRLLKERKHLFKLNDAISRREAILKKYSYLADNLGNQLYGIDTSSHNIAIGLSNYKISKSFAKTAVNQAAYIPLDVVLNLSNPYILAIKSVKALVGIGLETNERFNLTNLSNLIKTDINTQREIAPAYASLKELEKITFEQRLQTMALEKLAREVESNKINNSKISEKFEEIKREVNLTATAIKNHNKFTSIIRDFARAHNPFSKYNNSTDMGKEFEKKITCDEKYATKNQVQQNTLNSLKLNTREDKGTSNNNSLNNNFTENHSANTPSKNNETTASTKCTKKRGSYTEELGSKNLTPQGQATITTR